MSSFSRSQNTRKPGAVGCQGGVVAAQHAVAAETGADVLAAGGNAFDAAVAVSFALGVLEPWMSGPMGGGGMMLWTAEDQQSHALRFGMRSSASLDVAHYPLSGKGKASDLFPWQAVQDDRNVRGASSVAVPGTVAGMSAMHARFGTMPWAELLQPAIAHARKGLHVDWYASLIIGSSARELAADRDAAALFLEDGTWPKSAGWTALSNIRLDQSRHAQTLDQLAKAGAADFYRGDIGAALVKDVTEKGGFLTSGDLAGYEAEWQVPLKIPYGPGHISAMPGLTAGPTLAQAMAHWQSADTWPDPDSWQDRIAATGTADAAAYVAYAKAFQEAYAHRLDTMGDHEHPAAPGCTTHFSIVDRTGNMAAVTQTLLSIFGSKVVSPSTGMLLNNGIMWFDPEPGKPNSLGPDKACLMNICPVTGEAGGRRFALGASGGRKIMAAVGQIASYLIDGRMSLQEAFEAPRIDVSGGAQIVADARLKGPVTEALSAHGPTETVKRLPFPYAFACPAGVLREDGLNSGTTETFSPWGDGIEEADLPSRG